MNYQEFLELKHKRAEKLAAGKELLAKKDFAGHKALMDEVAAMNTEIDANEAQFAEEGRFAEGAAGKAYTPTPGAGEPKDGYAKAVKAFAAAARQGFPTRKAAGDMMQEGVEADGGYAVPQDIVTQIISHRDSKESLLSEVRVIPVKTKSGRRTIKKRSQHTGFSTVAEAAKYQTRVSELEATLTETSNHVDQLEESLAGAQQEAQAAQAEVTELGGRLEAAQADVAQAQEQVMVLAGRPVADTAEARVLRMSIETAAAAMPDEEAAQAPSLSKPWAVGETVEPGDRRYYAPTGLLYKVRDGQGHTTQESWTPDKTPALWAVVDITHAGTAEDPIPAARGMEYEYGKIYLDPEDGKRYLCKRTGEAEGGKITLHYLPHELIGQYFEEVTA